MNEAYLQYIWKHRLLINKPFLLVDGRSVKILHVGQHNLNEQGPDFRAATLLLDGLIWHGNIEIHVLSSDWFRHRHHQDSKYDSVILHVVFKHDRSIFIGQEELPTFELESWIDRAHFERFHTLIHAQSWIPCENLIGAVDSITIRQQLDRMLIQRLTRKAEELDQKYKALNGDLGQFQYELLAQAFGAKYNVHAFSKLSHILPISILQKINPIYRRDLLFAMAGFVEYVHREIAYLIHRYFLEPMELGEWNYKGLRKPGFPMNRLQQFVELLEIQDFHLNLSELLFLDKTSKSIITAKFMQNILINSLVVYLWWYADHIGQKNFKESAMDLLHSYSAESNTIITRWQSLGIKVDDAFDSQALLELKNEFCTFKKCLRCAIGYKILKG